MQVHDCCAAQACLRLLLANILWQQVNNSVLDQPQLHSLLPLPGITAVPGDRFRELYYWDSYWVIKGLLVSGMTDTATSEVRNLLSLVETYGHVPNGARVYYINRRCYTMIVHGSLLIVRHHLSLVCVTHHSSLILHHSSFIICRLSFIIPQMRMLGRFKRPS